MLSPGTNGHARKQAVQRKLTRPVSSGYKPSIWNHGKMYGPSDLAPLWHVLRDAPLMVAHPRVRLALNYYKSAISNAEFRVKGNSQEVADFALAQIERFWKQSLDSVQERSYVYGWGAGEALYTVRNGKMIYDDLIPFHSYDARVLTRNSDGAYYGMRVRLRGWSQRGKSKVLLWGPRKSGTKVPDDKPDVPAKGFWFVHRKMHSEWTGLTQLYASWRPWRRLSGLDGAENIVDAAFYRGGYQGPVVRFPDTDPPNPDAEDDADLNRDDALQMTENYKSGFGVAIPSTRDEQGNPLWEIEPPRTGEVNLGPHLEYIESLRNEISDGIGVPRELMEASETGSGYSGRAIPMEAFLWMQQCNADAMVSAFCEQILDPLIQWNFGKRAWCELEVKPLLQTKQQQAAAAQQPPGQQPMPAGPMSGMMMSTRTKERWTGRIFVAESRRAA